MGKFVRRLFDAVATATLITIVMWPGRASAASTVHTAAAAQQSSHAIVIVCAGTRMDYGCQMAP